MKPSERRSTFPSAPQLAVLSTLAVGFAVLAGCSDFEAGVNTGILEPVGIALDATVPGATSPSAAASGGTAPALALRVGGDTLVIESVRFSLEGIQVGRAGEECQFDADALSEDQDGCADFAFGPLVTNIPVNQPDSTLSGPVQAEAGSFDRLLFRFNPLDPTGDPDEISAAESNPDLRNASVAVEFTFAGEADSLKLAPTDTIRAEFRQLLTLEENQVGRVQWTTDVESWFRREEDGSLIDPRNPGAALRDTIRANVLESFSAEASIQ